MRPLVSIIIPSFNQGKYLRETLDSTLAQDYRPLEVLVLDGGSTDGSTGILRECQAPELQWWSEPDRGAVDAVNKGLSRATGAIQAIQSSDDIYLPGSIALMVEAFEADRELGLLYADVEYIDAASSVTGRTNLPPFTLANYVAKRMFIPQPSAFFTKAVAAAVGPWNEDISYAADADFYLRIATHFPTRKLERVVARYRYHDEQRDRAGERISRDWEAAVRDWIKREQPGHDLRSSALAGVHLTHAHYLDDRQWARRTFELYRALLLEPTLLLHDNFPRRELIPGRQPIWKLLSRIKRALGFLPRSR